MSLSNKQTEFINRNFDRTLDVAEGTPRSGKTTACILRFYDFLNTSKDSNFLVVGASQQQAFRLVMALSTMTMEIIWKPCPTPG